MTMASVFKAVADLAVGAKARRDAEYQDFLSFYRDLVETLPTEAVTAFGSMKVEVVEAGAIKSGWAIELTPTDFIWWKSKLEQGEVRFTGSADSVKLSMLSRIAKKAEAHRLSPAERKTLLALLDEPALD